MNSGFLSSSQVWAAGTLPAATHPPPGLVSSGPRLHPGRAPLQPRMAPPSLGILLGLRVQLGARLQDEGSSSGQTSRETRVAVVRGAQRPLTTSREAPARPTHLETRRFPQDPLLPRAFICPLLLAATSCLLQKALHPAHMTIIASRNCSYPAAVHTSPCISHVFTCRVFCMYFSCLCPVYPLGSPQPPERQSQGPWHHALQMTGIPGLSVMMPKQSMRNKWGDVTEKGVGHEAERNAAL